MSNSENCGSLEIAGVFDISACSKCGAPISADPPTEDTNTVLAKCANCDRHYYLSEPIEPSEGLDFGSIVEGKFCPKRQLSALSVSLVDMLVKVRAETTDRIDRRQSERHPIEIPVIAIPLDDQYQPTMHALEATTVDISIAGIAFVISTPVEANYWIVELGPTVGASTQLAMQPTRVEPSESGETWKVAGPFVSKIEFS